MSRINVIIKDPGYPPYQYRIPGSYKALKRFIGGELDIWTVATDFTLIGRKRIAALDEPFNAKICGTDFHGTVIFLGWENERFADVPTDLETFKKLFPQLFEENK